MSKFLIRLTLMRLAATAALTLSLWFSLWFYDWCDVHMGTKYAVAYGWMSALTAFWAAGYWFYCLMENKIK